MLQDHGLVTETVTVRFEPSKKKKLNLEQSYKKDRTPCFDLQQSKEGGREGTMALFAMFRHLHENIAVMPAGCWALASLASAAGMSGCHTFDRDGKRTTLSSLMLEAGNVCMPAF